MKRSTLAVMGALIAANAFAQTTQSVISGRVFDRDSGDPLPSAAIRYTNIASTATGQVTTNALGYYSLPLLSPGIYRLRVEHGGFQSGEMEELSLFVASRLRLDFPLRQLTHVLESGGTSIVFPPGAVAVLPFVGPDFESRPAVNVIPESPETSTLHATLSYVIDPGLVGRLPLPSRDIYTLLVTLPGVTAETSTGRGLGISVNGQRPSSTNFLLDGVENNDYLTTGPFTTIAPEATREYRISVNNFSAEFGGTAGALANAVTRAGSDRYHGLAYAYLNNDVLNANSFQSNASGFPRTSRKELFAGFQIGGPAWKDRLFFSGAYEYLRSRSRRDPITVQVPILERFRQRYPNSAALRLLEPYPPPQVTAPPGNALAAAHTFTEPASLNRSLGLARLDHVWPSREQRLFVRAVLADLTQPDFVYSLYPGFSSPLDNSSNNVAATYIRQFGSGITSEFRAGFRNGRLGFARPYPDVPTLRVLAGVIGVPGSNQVRLPGSDQPTEFRNRDRNFEIGNSTIVSMRSHLVTIGGGFLVRRPEPLLAFERDGRYDFLSLSAFAEDRPLEFKVTLNRPEVQSAYPQPQFGRTWSNNSFYGFVQDSWRPARRLSVTLGLRYEYFGALKNTGVQDVFIVPGAGPSIVERMRGATREFDATARRNLYSSDSDNWGARAGVAYHLTRRTVLRGAFGMFYDRLFDNLQMTNILNSFDSVSFDFEDLPPGTPRTVSEYQRPLSDTLAALSSVPQESFDLQALWLDEVFRSPRVDTWFSAVEHELSRSAVIQISYRGAVSRNLITTDELNRIEYPAGQSINSDFGEVKYRYNGASSDYHALGALLRYRTSRGQLQAAYTYGHSIDTQSEPLLGEFSNLNYARGQQEEIRFATFTRIGDSRSDRGSSDYDQRHNVVVFSAWEPPGLRGSGWLRHLTSDWQLAQVAAFRSGFPYTIVGCTTPCQAPSTGVALLRNRASLLAGREPQLVPATDVAGGKQLLNAAAFQNAPVGEIGNLGRNSLAGPGFWNVDISVGRTFRPLPARESVTLQFRADVFNVFNHANLGNPIPRRTDPAFGQAFYGRVGTESPLRIVPPANESPRQIQLQLRLSF